MSHQLTKSLELFEMPFNASSIVAFINTAVVDTFYMKILKYHLFNLHKYSGLLKIARDFV